MVLTAGPRGRLVQGNPFVAGTTDYDGKPLTKADGTPTQEFFFTVAYPKGDPASEAYIASIGQDCARFWPAQFPQGVTGPAPQFGAVHPRFSSKVIDGDGKDGKGTLNSTKEGFAGHWCVRYATAFAVQVYEAGKYDPMMNVAMDPGKHSLLKRGYFVRVASTRDTNASDQTPGLKVYPSMVEIVSAGPEILSGPDAGSVFGGSPAAASAPPVPGAAPAPAVPVGLQPVPGAAYTIEALRAGGWSDDQIVAGGYATRPAPVATPPLPATQPAVPAVPTPAASTPPVPAAAPVTPSPSNPAPPPYDGFMQTPAAPAGDPPTLPAANGATYQQLKDAGWTREMMVQHGMIAA